MTYLLRDVDDTVWRAAQDRAKAEGLAMSALIRLLVLGYAEGRIAVIHAAAVSLGKRGGTANSKAQRTARSKNLAAARTKRWPKSPSPRSGK